MQAFTASHARKEIEKLRGLPPDEQPHELVFMVSRAVSATTRRAIRKAWGDEASCHPDVARDLNNLAQLLRDTNRLAEAEPLMRRALAILLLFIRSTGYEHPHRQPVLANYRRMLLALGKTEAEIEAEIAELVESPPRQG